MAHYAKYDRGAVGAMLHHYRRDREATLERDNIRRELTHLNYVIGPDLGVERIQERIREVEASSHRVVRKNAVLMCDWVVTAPPDVRREDLQEFFDTCYKFVSDRYGGKENMLGGFVHMDETSPHIHIAFMPVIERENGRLTFSAQDMITRGDLSTFHQDLTRAVERSLGYQCQILLDEENTLEKSLSRIGSMQEYKAVKDGLERLRQREQELAERNRELGERAEELKAALRQEQNRERQIRQTYQARQKEIEGLASALREERERARGLDRAIERVRGRVEELVRQIGVVKERVKERIKEIGHRIVRDRTAPPEVRIINLKKIEECEQALRAADYLTQELREEIDGTIAFRKEKKESQRAVLDEMLGEIESKKAELAKLRDEAAALEKKIERYGAHALRYRNELAQAKEKQPALEAQIRELDRWIIKKESSVKEARTVYELAVSGERLARERKSRLPGLLKEREERARELFSGLSLAERLELDRRIEMDGRSQALQAILGEHDLAEVMDLRRDVAREERAEAEENIELVAGTLRELERSGFDLDIDLGEVSEELSRVETEPFRSAFAGLALDDLSDEQILRILSAADTLDDMEGRAEEIRRALETPDENPLSLEEEERIVSSRIEERNRAFAASHEREAHKLDLIETTLGILEKQKIASLDEGYHRALVYRAHGNLAESRKLDQALRIARQFDLIPEDRDDVQKVRQHDRGLPIERRAGFGYSLTKDEYASLSADQKLNWVRSRGETVRAVEEERERQQSHQHQQGGGGSRQQTQSLGISR